MPNIEKNKSVAFMVPRSFVWTGTVLMKAIARFFLWCWKHGAAKIMIQYPHWKDIESMFNALPWKAKELEEE